MMVEMKNCWMKKQFFCVSTCVELSFSRSATRCAVHEIRSFTCMRLPRSAPDQSESLCMKTNNIKRHIGDVVL